jgi:hypothetical protein
MFFVFIDHVPAMNSGYIRCVRFVGFNILKKNIIKLPPNYNDYGILAGKIRTFCLSLGTI